MSTAATIQELARQVRGDTLYFLEAAPADWLTWAPPGTSNHLLWHAGHALWVQDVICVRFLSGHEELPPAWSNKFGMNCGPVSQCFDWPTRHELQTSLQTQLQRILLLLAETSEEKLLEDAEPSHGPTRVVDRIIHGFHDEAKHSGEMYLLLKLRRASLTT